MQFVSATSSCHITYKYRHENTRTVQAIPNTSPNIQRQAQTKTQIQVQKQTCKCRDTQHGSSDTQHTGAGTHTSPCSPWALTAVLDTRRRPLHIFCTSSARHRMPVPAASTEHERRAPRAHGRRGTGTAADTYHVGVCYPLGKCGVHQYYHDARNTCSRSARRISPPSSHTLLPTHADGRCALRPTWCARSGLRTHRTTRAFACRRAGVRAAARRQLADASVRASTRLQYGQQGRCLQQSHACRQREATRL